MKRTFQIIFLSAVVTLLVVACNFPGQKGNGGAAATPDLINTAAALTVQAVQTELAQDPTELAQNTLVPTWTSEAAFTATPGVPTNTPLPTWTPFPTQTPKPAATNTPYIPCNQMSFVRDYTVPDGTWMQPKQRFTKIWEVKNTGTCTWDAAYSIVFANEGTAMGAPVSQPISDAPVEPGEVLKIALVFTAPNTDDDYSGRWRLQSGSGEEFGAFTVKITVDGNPWPFLLADYACSAEWRSNAGILPCPGDKGSSNGYVYATKKPVFETGYEDDENTIVMAPRAIEDGETRGEFYMMRMPTDPAFFATVIGCMDQKPNCDVIMTLKYRLDGDATEHTIGQWDERFDGSITTVNIDLSGYALEDKLVHWIFYVEADGAATDDVVFWLNPRVYVP
ncbi:MAG: hypothetical protein HPY85_10250 [Anaerolineae bacterium]|nr:hypothetical protein [Anaerolineae bacterium]